MKNCGKSLVFGIACYVRKEGIQAAFNYSESLIQPAL